MQQGRSQVAHSKLISGLQNLEQNQAALIIFTSRIRLFASMEMLLLLFLRAMADCICLVSTRTPDAASAALTECQDCNPHRTPDNANRLNSTEYLSKRKDRCSSDPQPQPPQPQVPFITLPNLVVQVVIGSSLNFHNVCVDSYLSIMTG